jgi:hypothetical protein
MLCDLEKQLLFAGGYLIKGTPVLTKKVVAFKV